MSQIKDIETHVSMLATARMKKHAMTGSEGDHDLSFQIFRYLSGYDDALNDLERLQQEIVDIKESMIEPLSMLETYWELIPNCHRMTCRESFLNAFILAGLEISDE